MPLKTTPGLNRKPLINTLMKFLARAHVNPGRFYKRKFSATRISYRSTYDYGNADAKRPSGEMKDSS